MVAILVLETYPYKNVTRRRVGEIIYNLGHFFSDTFWSQVGGV
jgi:hypothetical protein